MKLSYTTFGVVIGIVIAFALLLKGLGGLLVVLLLAAIGGLVGAHLEGRIDLRNLPEYIGRSGRG